MGRKAQHARASADACYSLGFSIMTDAVSSVLMDFTGGVVGTGIDA